MADQNEELKQLRSEVQSLKDALQKVLASGKPQESAHAVADDESKKEEGRKTVMGATGKEDDIKEEKLDEKGQWINFFGWTTEELDDILQKSRDGIFWRGIPDYSKAFHHAVREELYCLENKFIQLAGDSNAGPKTVVVRDFYEPTCRKLLQFDAKTDEELWMLLSRPRCIGSKTSGEGFSFEKIAGEYGLNEASEVNTETGLGEYPAYGREIIINELTPNIALMLMISTNEMGRWNNHEQPYYYLWSAIEHALEPGVLRFESASDNYMHRTFSFDATFFEFVEAEDEEDEEDEPRPNPICDGSGKFGPQLYGPFAPGQTDTPWIRESTISLVFDCVPAERGTYWTLYSLGMYDEETAFNKPVGSMEDEPAYNAPEELFLDKLARVIDWAVDDGAARILAKLDSYLEVPVDTLFNKEDNERLLFDDVRFTRTKKYHWAMQWLGKLSKSMVLLLQEIEEVVQDGLPILRENAAAHKQRAGIKNNKVERKSGLRAEKTFLRKVARAREVRDRIETKMNEVKDLRDALVNASGVLESRAAVSQAETVYILTLIMLIYLPATTVISVFGMDVVPDSSKTLTAFWITMVSVFLVTSMLSLNMGSFVAFSTTHLNRLCGRLQNSMSHLGSHSWKERSHRLKEWSEAAMLTSSREQRIPVSWYFTWYVLMWVFIVFPAQEVRKVGGVKQLANLVGQGGSERWRWIWDGALVPLRIALLPLHALMLLLDYILLVIFSVSIVGRDDNDRVRQNEGPGVGDAASAPLETLDTTSITPILPKARATTSPWKVRFSTARDTLLEFSSLGLDAAGTQNKVVSEPGATANESVASESLTGISPLRVASSDVALVTMSPIEATQPEGTGTTADATAQLANSLNLSELFRKTLADSQARIKKRSAKKKKNEEEGGRRSMALSEAENRDDGGDCRSVATSKSSDSSCWSHHVQESDEDEEDGEAGTDDAASTDHPMEAVPEDTRAVPANNAEGSRSIQGLVGGIVRGRKSEERDLEKGSLS